MYYNISGMSEYLELPKDIYLDEKSIHTVDSENETIINKKVIETLYNHHKTNNINRYETLSNYYIGKAKILDRQKNNKKSNNKLVLDYPSYIVDVILGMFIGNPVNYTVTDEYIEEMEVIQQIMDNNDEQDENTEISKMAGIKGRAYEIVYIDEEGSLRFNEVEPENMILVYDTKINPEPLLAIYIRYIYDIDNLDTKGTAHISVYTKNEIIEYKEGDNGLELITSDEHIFKSVPVIEFLNNDEGIGDFERVIPLIDAMNKSQSDTANDFEEFTDALLILGGMIGSKYEDIQKMLDDGILLLDTSEGSKQMAEWLVKIINDEALENYKQRLDNDIHKFAKVPNMSDEQFAGNVSGEAMKYKLIPLNQVIIQKQRKFKTGLLKRLELICDYYNLVYHSSFDYKNINIEFKDNKPINEKENVEMVKDLLGIVSNSTALSKLWFMEDVNEEINKIEEETDIYYNRFIENTTHGLIEEQEENKSDNNANMIEDNII